jgi:hypothetical protein
MERVQTKVPKGESPAKSRGFFQAASEQVGILLFTFLEGVEYVGWSLWGKRRGDKIEPHT